MPARDSNNSTWYDLRYAEDFNPRTDALNDASSPSLDASLHFDNMRHVLELRPEPLSVETEPLPGRAVDVDGNIYFVDAKTCTIRVRRCDGSEVPLLCDRDVFASPAGMAIDRRGLLYVSDRVARRVVVIEPDSGSVQDIFGIGELSEPVDIAITANAQIHVADRAAGSIVSFDARHHCVGHFRPQNFEGIPVAPKPIAIMVEADGSLLVADSSFPCLLRFSRDLKPLADAELSSYVHEIAGSSKLSLDSLAGVYGKRLPRFLAGVCSTHVRQSTLSHDGGQSLVEVHRTLRLLGLRLDQRFADNGVFISAVLDSGRPGSTWHRVQIDAELPTGTKLFIETATADDQSKLKNELLVNPDSESRTRWDAPSQNDRLIPFSPLVSDQLIQSPPGRYLRLRVTLESDGHDTPRVSSIRVRYPRVSYLDLLPPVFRRDPESAKFLERFLALFEGVFTGIEDRYEEFSRQLNPDSVPREIIDWLACLVDLSFDPSWPIEKRRALISEAMELYRTRGTVRGLERYVEIYTGHRPLIQERFLERPSRPAYLGSQGSVLGCSFALRPACAILNPEEDAFRSFAHRFLMLVFLEDECDAELILPVVQRIVAVNKPAHTLFGLRVVLADARVGLQSTVGADFVLGGRESLKTAVGGCPIPGGPAIRPGVLGVDSILGGRRPEYVRPISQGLS